MLPSVRLMPLALLCCLALTGCGGKGSLSGQVSYKGKPVVLGTVRVLASDNLTYNAPIEENGAYRVDNIPKGPSKLLVFSIKPEAPGNEVAAGRPKGSLKGNTIADTSLAEALKNADKWFAIPKKYSDPATTDLLLTIKKGPQSFNVELKD